MTEDNPQFSIVRRGYDRAQVDQQVYSLETALSETRSQVAGLDARILRLSGELAEAQERLREHDRPSYAGLGSKSNVSFVPPSSRL